MIILIVILLITEVISTPPCTPPFNVDPSHVGECDAIQHPCHTCESCYQTGCTGANCGGCQKTENNTLPCNMLTYVELQNEFGRHCRNAGNTSSDDDSCDYATNYTNVIIDITNVSQATSGMFCLSHYELKDDSGQCEDDPSVRRIATVEECAANWVGLTSNPPSHVDNITQDVLLNSTRPGGCGRIYAGSGTSDPFSFYTTIEHPCDKLNQYHNMWSECLCKRVSPPEPTSGTPPVFPTSR